MCLKYKRLTLLNFWQLVKNLPCVFMFECLPCMSELRLKFLFVSLWCRCISIFVWPHWNWWSWADAFTFSEKATFIGLKWVSLKKVSCLARGFLGYHLLLKHAHEIIKQGFKTRLGLKEYHKCKQKHDVLFCALYRLRKSFFSTKSRIGVSV